ncbi:hypothetical protein CHS0354_023607 [Potamilus streckersoni]|uniref:Uncharacterized protein n=1 Tax=Potamilus streckersoni TaxID=2493646 RepID=A0AAE0SN15_9BIVA|nr:hypothetical protein CHS0354_023607 [Potamilus streckersoni]
MCRIDIDWIDSDIVSVDSDIDWNESDIYWIESDVDCIESDIDLIESDIVWIESDIDWIDSEIDWIDIDIDWIENDIVWIENDIDLTESDIVWIHSDIDRIDSEIDWISSDFDWIDSDIDWTERDIVWIDSDLDSEIDWIDSNIDWIKSDIDWIENDLKPRKKSLIEEVKEKVNWNQRVMPTWKDCFDAGDMERPLTVCFSFRREQDVFSHTELKKLIAAQIGCKVIGLQYDPVSVRTADPSANDRWFATLEDPEQCKYFIQKGLVIGPDKIMVRSLDDVIHTFQTIQANCSLFPQKKSSQCGSVASYVT